MRQLIYFFLPFTQYSHHSRDLHLRFELQNVRPSPADTENFINEFLKKDGVVVLRLIDSNVGYVNMSDILYQLWNNFYSIDAKKLAAPPAQALTDS